MVATISFTASADPAVSTGRRAGWNRYRYRRCDPVVGVRGAGDKDYSRWQRRAVITDEVLASLPAPSLLMWPAVSNHVPEKGMRTPDA